MPGPTVHPKGPFRWVLFLTAILSPVAALPQAQPTPTADDAEQLYLQLIDEREEAGGLTSPDLVEPLTALGMQYYEARDYERAAEAFTQARQITRVNQGFNTAAEAVLISHVVHAEEALGNLDVAWELEQQMLEIAKLHVGSIETAPLFGEVAEKRMDVLRRYRSGEMPPQIELGCYYRRRVAPTSPVSADTLSTSQCRAGNTDTVQQGLLTDALEYQMLALEALMQNGLYASDEFSMGVTKVFRASYGIWRLRRLYGDPIVRMALNRLLGHRPANLAERVRRAEILVQVADMNIVRRQHSSRFVDFEQLMMQYELAYTELSVAGFGQAALDAMFEPALPVVLPVLNGNPLLTTGGSESGYIDVAFDVTHKGNSAHIEVVGATADVTRAQRRALVNLIQESAFRPRTTNGRIVESSHVTLRYYLTQQE